MENEKINVEVKLGQYVDAEVDLYDIIDTINNMPNLRKWNIIGYILNEINLDFNNTNSEQKEIIKQFLETQLDKLKKESDI